MGALKRGPGTPLRTMTNDTTFKTSQLSYTPICNLPSSDDINELNHLRNENPFRIVLAHVNINKFGLSSANLNILMISDTKIDNMPTEFQFIIKEFLEPYGLDHPVNSGEILLYIRGDIPTKCIKWITVFEGFFIELTFKFI